MRRYAAAVVAQIKNPARWPGVSLLENFNDLQATVSVAAERASLEGDLASILLMHQVAEEFVRTLDDDSILYMQVRLFPFPFVPTRRPKRMFGQLLEDLESRVWFPSKKYILEDARTLNQIRIPVVHGLARPGALKAATNNVERARAAYSRFVWLALEAHLRFHGEFADYMDDTDWPPRDVQYYSNGGRMAEDAFLKKEQD